MIKEVEGLSTKIQSKTLAETEFLLESRIDLVVSGPARRVTAQVTPGPIGGQHERRRVEPVVDGLIGGIDRDARNQVGALRAGVAVGKLAGAAFDGDVHRTAGA